MNKDVAATLRFLALASLLCLTACQSSKSAAPAEGTKLSPEQQRVVQFTRDAQRAIWRRSFISNVDALQGRFALVFSIERDGQVVACDAEPLSDRLTDLPAYNAVLAEQMKAVCWSSVLPELPPELVNGDKVSVLKAPLIFPVLDATSEQARLRALPRYAQDLFFWEHTLAMEPLESIGIARFKVSANAQGVVESCEVVIDPHPLRRRQFKQDNALVDRLTQRCKQVDLRQMPAFRLGEDGLASASVSVEYTPWRKKGAKKP